MLSDSAKDFESIRQDLLVLNDYGNKEIINKAIESCEHYSHYAKCSLEKYVYRAFFRYKFPTLAQSQMIEDEVINVLNAASQYNEINRKLLDISLVCQQAAVNPDQALKALQKHNEDIVNAIMDLTSNDNYNDNDDSDGNDETDDMGFGLFDT